jgi:hypothetical protein
LYLWYTLPQDRSDQQTTVHSVVRVTRSLVLCVRFVDRCLSFVPFRLVIVLSVLLPFTDSDYPFGIFKLFFQFVFFY